MKAKPRGLERRHAEQFSDESVAAAYSTRPPYPTALDRLFIELAGGPGAHLLDLGCGIGELARRLAPKFRAVTAIDQSAPMIVRGRTLPGGGAPNLRWVTGRVEDAALDGPFTGALAAESFHWFDWQTAVPRLVALVPTRRLILAERKEAPSPWSAGVAALLPRFSTNREFEPYDLVEELISRKLLRIEGRVPMKAQPFTQTLDDYVTSFHSRNGFSRERMAAAAARQFDDALRAVMAPFARDGVVTLSIDTRVVWGCMQAP